MTKKGHRQYTDAQKADAVLLVEAAGYPNRPGAILSVAQRIKIPESTLRTWVQRTHGAPPAELCDKKKEDLTELLKKAAHALVGHLIEIADMGDVRETATAVGIVIDKLQLLTGEPTANTNQRIIIDYVEDIVTQAATVAEDRYLAIEADERS